MTFYTGTAFPHWRRNVFVAGLREGVASPDGWPLYLRRYADQLTWS